MAKFTKAKLLRLRDNADRLLKKMAQEEKDRYKKLALSFKDSQLTIDKILNAVKGDKGYEKLVVLLKDLKNEIGEAIKISAPDMRPVVQAVDKLVSVMKSKRGYSDVGIINNLTRIEKLLAKKTKPVVDNSDKIIKAIKKIKFEIPKIDFPDTINVGNFPPTKTPMPVTNVNINPLRGFIHTTAATVTTSLTKLPTYGVLDDRRAIMIFNNSSSTTIYIGGSNVTSLTGLPILAQTYSPVIDAGTRMILYGRTSAGSANVRVMEISNEKTGG